MSLSLDSVRENYLTGNDFWALEPVNALEASEPGAALAWAIGAARHLVGVEPAPEETTVRAALAALEDAAMASRPDALLALAEGLEGHDAGPQALAAAHLLVARARSLEGDQRRYRHHVATGMRFLGRSEHYRSTAMDYPLSQIRSRVPATRAG